MNHRTNHRNRRAVLATAVTLSLCAAFPAFAGDGVDNGEILPLERVVVTANRMEVPVDEALASVTVITREDIERSQAPDILDLLGRQPGIDIARTGGAGQASTIFTRGTNSSHTLLLIDGIRVNAATQGVFDLAHLPLAQVERIEIVRGPRAALWGSDAIGGVIQVFTRDPSQSFFEAHAGSYGRAGTSAGVGMARGESQLGVAAGFEELEGFSATRPGNFSYNPDHDGYRNRNLALRARTVLGSQQLAFTGLLTGADVEFDEGRTSVLNRLFGITVSGDLGARWSHALSVGHSSEDLDTPVYLSRFGSERTSVDWNHALALNAANTLNVGVNWSGEKGYSLEAGSGFRESRHNAGLFASWRGHFGTQLIEAAVRHDNNSQFGGANTGNFAWGWQAAERLNLRASWGQGFRAPNFNELYYPGFFGLFAGNPALQPERSRSAELGLDWRASPAQALGMSIYRTRVSDLIAFEGPGFQAINVASASIDGAELDYHLTHGKFALDANATWQDARDDASGAPLLRRAPRKLFVSANYLFGNGLGIGLDASAVSRRPDFGGSELGGYGRVDLRASAPLSAGWVVEARIENIGDRDYLLVDGYNTAGRSGMLTLRHGSP